MSKQQNEAVVRRLFEAHNRHDPALLDGVLAPDYVNHSAPPGQQDRAARIQMVKMYVEAAPDLHTEIDDILAEGDKVGTRWHTRATFSGRPLQTPLGVVQPNGKPTLITGITITRVANDQIAEEWIAMDELGLLQQIGALPAAPAGGS